MSTRIVRGFGVLVALGLVVGSASAASFAWQRYTFPAAPPAQVISPGTMTVQLPAGWDVKTTWGSAVGGRAPIAHSQSVPTAAWWWVGVSLEEKSTTIGDVRARMLSWAGTPVWGEGTPMRVYSGDSYVTLPIGKVWRYTLALVPPKGETNFKLSYERNYVLDRGVVATRYGPEKHLFSTFTVICSAQFCKAHNGQLAKIMRSIRITP